MSTTKTIDISKLSEAQQNLFKSLFEQFCERSEPKEEKKSKPKVWKPEYGDWYWYISSDGQVYNCEWENDRIDQERYSMGNCFRTKEEAEFAGEKQKVKTELQRYDFEHYVPNLVELYVNNGHYFILYLPKCDALEIVSMCSRRMESVTYFTSENIAEDAMKEIGKKRIMKYLFDVDCEVDE